MDMIITYTTIVQFAKLSAKMTWKMRDYTLAHGGSSQSGSIPAASKMVERTFRCTLVDSMTFRRRIALAIKAYERSKTFIQKGFAETQQLADGENKLDG